jgi:hypothetical protein
MSSLYKNGNYYYISVTFEGKRTVKSLGTKDKKVTKALKPFVEQYIYFDVDKIYLLLF